MNKNEERITAETGGAKCSKLAQMADIPAEVLLELMEHYGKGRAKYPGDDKGPNYAKGYKWSLSYNALMRHILQFWGGEDIDTETGSKHMIAAAWHCLCLAHFMNHHREQDDRWENPVPAYITAGYESGPSFMEIWEKYRAEYERLADEKETPPRSRQESIAMRNEEAPAVRSGSHSRACRSPKNSRRKKR